MPELTLTAGVIASQFISAVSTGRASEAALIGPRGEGKTQTAALAVITHAKFHEQAGFKLPFPWMCIAETFKTHEDKTVPSLKEDHWQGAWQFSNNNHTGIFKTNKVAATVDFLGIEDDGAIDRVRRGIGGMWAEEVAPATTGRGVPELAWTTGLTSRRVKSHGVGGIGPAILTSNLPDDSHWMWKRFKPAKGTLVGSHPDHQRRMYFRIPKGENQHITDEMRLEWRENLSDRPDLIARLLDGEPGAVQIGRAVATQFVNGVPVGFNEEKHVSKERLKVIPGVPFYIGQDWGLCPVTTVAQQHNGRLYVYASFVIEAGARQQYEFNVLPFFQNFAKGAIHNNSMIHGCYDPSAPTDQSDSDRNPLDIVHEMLGGYWEPGPVDWESRKNAMLRSFNKGSLGTGFTPWVQLDPIGCEVLIDALRSRWHYSEDRFGNVTSEKPNKKNSPYHDCGDSYTYMVCGALPDFTREQPKDQGRVFTNFDPRFINDRRFSSSEEDAQVISNFDPRM